MWLLPRDWRKEGVELLTGEAVAAMMRELEVTALWSCAQVQDGEAAGSRSHRPSRGCAGLSGLCAEGVVHGLER
jgi:hypothetical protein